MYSSICDVCGEGIPRNVGYVMWVAAGKALTAHKECRPVEDDE
ncbi:hypothetical protein [Streptomyces sp. Isolate_219]|nr:hypothetical protein [Streptomyces sp. Isolate_219]